MMKIFIVSLLFLAALVSQCQARERCDKKLNPCKNNGICTFNHRCRCKLEYYGELCQHHHKCYPQCQNGTLCVHLPNGKAYCKGKDCKRLADIAIALDCSGSISSKQFGTMVDTVLDFISYFEIGDNFGRVALFAFNDFLSKMNIDLKDYDNKKDLMKAVNKFRFGHPGGGTRTEKALIKLYNDTFIASKGDRKAAPNIGIVFTDGQSNRPNLTTKAAEAIKRDTDIHMIAIGIGDDIDYEELKRIASSPSDVIRTTFKKLRSKVSKLVNLTCVTAKDPCENNPCLNGGKCCLFKTTYYCKCKHPYVGVNCQYKCDIRGDIMFAIDESGSISRKKFDQMIDSVMFFIKSLDVENGKVRIGIITFALDVFVHYDLDAFDDKLDLLFVCNLLRFRYRGGPTFTHKALRYLVEYSFTTLRGDRPRYPNYAIVMSDGRSRFPWKTRYYAEKLHRKATVFAIGIGPKVNKHEMYLIASYPKRKHVIITWFWRLKRAMMRVGVQVCKDLIPGPPCIKCTKGCKCLPGMKCCNKCCRDTACVLMFHSQPNESNIRVCPTCIWKNQCGSNKDCYWPKTECFKGCCHSKLYVRRLRYRACKSDRHCRPGQLCCRGMCKRPIKLEVACMGKRVCYQFPAYKKCGHGFRCCRKCYHGDVSHIWGYGSYFFHRIIRY